MSLPLELLDKYQTTVLDFWRLRPRQFLAGLKNHPSKYMTPGLFAGLSVVIVLALDIVANQLMVPVAQKLGYSNMPPAESLAAFDLALLLALFVGVALFYRVISKSLLILCLSAFSSCLEFTAKRRRIQMADRLPLRPTAANIFCVAGYSFGLLRNSQSVFVG